MNKKQTISVLVILLITVVVGSIALCKYDRKPVAQTTDWHAAYTKAVQQRGQLQSDNALLNAQVTELNLQKSTLCGDLTKFKTTEEFCQE